MDRVSIPLIIAKGYRAIVKGDPRLMEVFPNRRPPSLREKLNRAKVSTPQEMLEAVEK